MARLWFTVGAMLFCLATGLRAGEADRRQDRFCPDIAMLSAYAAQAMGLERLDACPPIVFSPTAPGTDGMRQDGAAARTIGTTFYPDSGTILLSVRTDLTSVEGMALILHELVHFYQYAYGIDQQLPCREALEPQAFAVQAQFLSDNGLDAAAARVRSDSARRGYCATGRRASNTTADWWGRSTPRP